MKISGCECRPQMRLEHRLLVCAQRSHNPLDCSELARCLLGAQARCLCSNIVCCFSNQSPSFAQVLFRRQDISETNSHDSLSAQFGLCEIRASRSVDSLNNAAV